MNWPLIIGAIILGAAVGLFIMYRRESKKSIQFISQETFIENMRKAQLVDIRKKDVFDAGHINGARNIPSAVLLRQPGRLRNDLPIYLVDEKGKACKRAAMMLYGRGFENIYALEGGMDAWTGAVKTTKK